jgi:peptidoglycan/LPS O-acetylase OafA/YrhL
VKNLHFPLLDPLRFAAALGVAVFHLTFWSWAWPSIGVAPGFEHYVAADLQFQSAASFTWFGWVGVEIFFVISGFVIANSARNVSAREFLFGRALRLYPDLHRPAGLCERGRIQIRSPLHQGHAARSQRTQRPMA